MKLPFWPNPKGYRDISLGLSRVYDLLARIGNPHKNLPPTIHIAGTNGKGSTLAFVQNMLEKSGYKIHLYTSPHLVEFNERIILSGQKISDEFLNECLLECKKACEIEPKIEPTFFEGITAAAFLAFSKTKADFLLLETGMGGRLDATNVIEKNLCSIITPISFDHTEFLGDSLAKISFEKASIIKKNCPVFIGRQTPEALEVIKNYAAKMNSKTQILGQDFEVEILENGWNFSQNFGWWRKIFKKKWCNLPFPSLMGKHQIDNASVALSLIISQNLAFVKKNSIKSAITSTTWPARLEKITSGRFFEQKKSNFELFLDGSHNLAGAKTINEFLRKNSDKKRFVVFSMLQDKDCAGFLNEIKNEIDFLISLPIEKEQKSRSAVEIEEIAKKLNINSFAVANFDEAFTKINSINVAGDALILVCGSLYLAGYFLSQNLSSQNKIL